MNSQRDKCLLKFSNKYISARFKKVGLVSGKYGKPEIHKTKRADQSQIRINSNTKIFLIRLQSSKFL